MASPTPVPARIRFDAFELDAASGELRKANILLKLQPQPFRVLLLLIEQAGQVVTREDIQRCLWTDSTFVDFEHGINFSINQIRGALADSAENPRYVETIPKRGYRFIGAVEQPVAGSITVLKRAPEPERETVGPRRWLAIASLLTVVVAAVGYCVYLFFGRKGAVPYENFTISQITNTGKAIAAAISPDGKFLLSVVDDQGKQSLWLRNILTSSYAQVIPPEDAQYADAAFSPDGNYIYFRKYINSNDDVTVILRSPVLGGSPQVVARDVDTAFTFSPEGKRVAYVRAKSEVGKFQVLVAHADGSDEKLLSDGPISALPSAIAWSPDGKQIASAIPDSGDAFGTIQLQDVASAKTQTLGRFNEKFVDLAWLPDGHGLLATYVGLYAGSVQRSQVGFISYPGGQFSTVTKDTNSYQTLTLSAGGKSLVTVQQRISQTLYLIPAAGFAGQPPNPAPAQNRDSSSFGWASNGDLYFAGALRISADGRNSTSFLSNPMGQIGRLVNCGADGRYVLVTLAGPDGSNKSNIWRLDSDGSHPKQLTDGVFDTHPRCSPDGAWVYYYDYKVAQINRVQINGGTPEIVPGTITPGGYSKIPAVSPDGKLLAFEAGIPGSTQIALVNLDAGAEPPRRMIVHDPRFSGWPQFTPDGKAIVYQISQNSVDNLWLQPLDGSRGRQITNFQSDVISAFEYSPDGKTLGVLGSHTESDVVLLRDTGASHK
jgi:eukaryotic-like serine/threonine-protein kinase